MVSCGNVDLCVVYQESGYKKSFRITTISSYNFGKEQQFGKFDGECIVSLFGLLVLDRVH